MSRRHTSTPIAYPVTRVVGVMLVVALALTALLPSAASAQNARIRDQDVEQRWQLLTYIDASGELEAVPAGVGATLQLFSNSAFGEAACSTYESSYSRQKANLFIDPPVITRVECDPVSQAFDDAFYRNLTDVASIDPSDSIMTMKDQIGEEIMTLTRAKIDEDPTVARWDLARIGAADGSVEPVIQGLDPWIEFLRGGRLVGSTGCGSFLGSYGINDGTMSITDVAYRLEACTEGARRQAERVVATFDGITDFEVLPAGLALQDADGVTRLALTPDIDLGRRIWTPISIFGANGEVAFEGNPLSTSAVQFDANAADGRTICRPFSGDGLRSGLALNVSGIQPKGRPCPRSRPNKKNPVVLQDVETAFIEALEAAASHALRGSELELKDVDGRTLMRLLPQADLVGTNWVVKWLGPNRKAPAGDDPITATFEDIEVVLGETGAADATGTNIYIASYRTPAAARIRIWDAKADGRACRGKKKNNAECKQQTRFLNLLQSADGYIVRGNDLRLLKGTRDIIAFEPDLLATLDG